MRTSLILLSTVAVVVIAFVAINYLQVQDTSKGRPEISFIPEEVTIYENYLDVIEGESRHFHNVKDIGTVEATIISLTQSEVCPYQEEECRIEPYPKDTGVVRIDKIISYTPYSEQTVQQPIEQVGQPTTREPEEEKTTSQYTGQDLPKQNIPEYTQLEEGQEVSTIFQVTTRPVKVRYMTVYELRGGPEGEFIQRSVESDSNESSELIEVPPTGTVNISDLPLPKKIYKPIPKEVNYFVFTTKVFYSEVEEEPFPEPEVTTEKIFLGLKEGDKFKATITYMGTLRVNEYDIISPSRPPDNISADN